MSLPSFPHFGRYVCEGDSVTLDVDGFTVTATVHRDDSGDAPWDCEDGHGPVSEWTRRDKAPGERVLCSDRDSKRFYDVAEATRLAKRDGWDAPPYGTGTKGERAARAVEADFKALRAWCNDEWFYCGVALTVSRNVVDLTGKYSNALWGIECNWPGSDNSYLAEVAQDLLDEALDEARAKLGELCAA